MVIKMKPVKPGPQPEPAHDWLALFYATAQAGSFARGPDRAEVLDRCCRIAASDWSGMIELPKTLKIGIIDVQGYEDVEWDFHGIFGKDPEGNRINLLDSRQMEIEEIEITAPKRRKRA